MKHDDALLVAACRKNDPKACRELYERFAPQMYAICLRYTRTNADAEDVLHDGFIKVFNSLHKLRESDSLYGWIKSIMVYTAINNYNRSNPIANYDTEAEETVENSYDCNLIYDNIDIEFILENIRQLPPRYQMAFNLCEIEELSFDEAAERLSVSSSTVRSNLSRAKHILAEKLKPYFK